MTVLPTDEDWMRRALEWSARGRGWTSPRPSVGCVLVRDGRVLGGGHTQPGDGNPHAEIVALNAAREAGEEVRGATAYVTLEPCSHYATTPPCTNALIAAGVRRVVCGVEDPNPAVSGRGFAQLREAGIEVVSGVLAAQCRRAQEQFLKHITQHLPFTTLKFAASLDGRIALPSGESQWISGAASRRRAHQLRHEHDAVLIGIGTALADDPQLNVRLEGEWKQPARIVLDSRARLPLHAKLLQDTQSTPLLIAVTPDAPRERVQALEARGAQILEAPAQGGRVDLEQLWPLLYEHGVCSVLVEGGPTVLGALLRAKLADKLVAFIAPLLLGDGLPAVQGFRVAKLADAPRLLEVENETCGDDMLLSGYLREWWK
jgi:diaminohydroxyphosphoribosylaminopyrimidine deaminase/5-amino-6-(5-phosphoribosylamino)uracil reductase